MRLRYLLPALLLLAISCKPAFAVSDITVSSLVMPAWVLHEGRTAPLSVGMALVDGDQVSTGNNARVLLRSADGSDIKLGADASLIINGLSKPRNDPSLFAAFLTVSRGAFRFTTSAVAKLKQRDISIHVADATIGIRGTDVWGKDGDDKRVVCLIEGKISIQPKDNAAFVMDQALTFYDMPKDLPSKAVAPVPTDKLAKWALETEIIAKQGAVTPAGRWKVILLAANDESQALSAYDEWRNAGYNVSIMPTSASNGHQYQLRITHLATREDAQQLADSVRGKLGAITPVVSQ